MPDSSSGKPPPAPVPPGPPDDDFGSSTMGHARRARDGDPLAWETLVSKLRAMLREGFARKRFPRPFTLDDLIAVTLEDVFRGFGKFQFGPDANFRGWVMRMAQNNHRDMQRNAGRDKREPQDALSLEGGSDSSPGLRAFLADPDGQRPSMYARIEELSAAFQNALAKLRPETRRVIELRQFHALPYEEIAREIGRNKVETVKAIYHRGMEQVQEELEGFR